MAACAAPGGGLNKARGRGFGEQLMAALTAVLLDDRGVILVEGADTEAFLQGLVTNDVARLGPDNALYAGLLTPQGKYLHDFFLSRLGATVAIDCERARMADLMRRLTLYRLRAKVSLEDATDRYAVAAIFGTGTPRIETASVHVDPRLEALGWRALMPRDDAAAELARAGMTVGAAADYDLMRLRLGVPDGSRDILVEKSFLLEANFEELNGVDFDKGCYVGQENTTRQKRRGAVRKRLMRVDIDGAAPPPDAAITLADKPAGTMRSSGGGTGIALLRLEYVARARESGEPLRASEARLTPVKPDWARY